MLYANHQDAEKIEKCVAEILTSTDARMIFVGMREFYSSCKLSRLNRSKFAEEVNDCLAGTSFCKEHGTWLFAEYEMSIWVFIRLGNKNESVDAMTLVKRGDAHAYDFKVEGRAGLALSA